MKHSIIPTSKNIATGGEKRKLTSLEKIFLHYTNDRKLSAAQEEQRNRLEAAFTLLCNYHSPEQAVPILQAKFDISRPTAYRLIRDATNLFGDVNASNKEGYRHILYEYAMKTYQLAAKNHDHREMNRAVANMIKLKGLDRDDPDLPDFAKLEQHNYNIVLPANITDFLTSMTKSGSLNLSEVRKKLPIPKPETDIEDAQIESEEDEQ